MENSLVSLFTCSETKSSNTPIKVNRSFLFRHRKFRTKLTPSLKHGTTPLFLFFFGNCRYLLDLLPRLSTTVYSDKIFLARCQLLILWPENPRRASLLTEQKSFSSSTCTHVHGYSLSHILVRNNDSKKN